MNKTCKTAGPGGVLNAVALATLWLAGATGGWAVDTPATSGDISLALLLDDMTNLARLPEFPAPAYSCRQFSSYDRASKSPGYPSWFANNDCGQYLRVEDKDGRKEYVMMDAQGPGAIVRANEKA